MKDFLDGAISGSPDHGIQIAEAATSFRQLSVVWNLARSAKGGRLRERLRHDPGPLLAAVTRLLRAPAWETVRVAGGIATRELDITFEARLAIVVEMAADLGGDGFLDAAADLVAIVDRDWLERRPDFRSAARFLRRSSGTAHASMVRLREAVRSGLLASLTRTPDLEGFDAVMDETATTGRAQLSPSERSVMSTAFVKYLAKQFDDDLANADGEGEHEELLAKVSAVSDWLGVSSDAAQSRVSEILDGFREDEEEAEAVHPVAGAPSVQAGDDASIRNLFDGLRI